MFELMTWQGECEGYAPRHVWLTEAGEDLALLFTDGRPSQYSHIDSPATIRRPWFKFAVFFRDRHLIQFYLFLFYPTEDSASGKQLCARFVRSW